MIELALPVSLICSLPEHIEQVANRFARAQSVFLAFVSAGNQCQLMRRSCSSKTLLSMASTLRCKPFSWLQVEPTVLSVARGGN